MFSEIRKRARKAGQPPGTLLYTGKKRTQVPRITVTTYDANTAHEMTGSQLVECLPQEMPSGTVWINVEGLQDVSLVSALAERFGLHPLTVEDVLNTEQRPKVEEFEGYVFITLKMLHLSANSSKFFVKQLSLVLGKNYVLSFQESDTAIFDLIRARLQTGGHQRLRDQGADYLAYRLIDVVVDQYFLILEMLGDQIEKTEERIIAVQTSQKSQEIYRLKRRMLLLRKAIWPMREAISHLLHGEEHLITAYTRVYLRDVYDHTVQAIDTLETFRDMLSSMLDMYLSSLTNRMNEIMKTLTIITTIFIPITSIASIYGMNFSNMPGLHWRWGYCIVMGVMLLIALLMLLYFRKKKWM